MITPLPVILLGKHPKGCIHKIFLTPGYLRRLSSWAAEPDIKRAVSSFPVAVW